MSVGNGHSLRLIERGPFGARRLKRRKKRKKNGKTHTIINIVIICMIIDQITFNCGSVDDDSMALSILGGYFVGETVRNLCD